MSGKKHVSDAPSKLFPEPVFHGDNGQLGDAECPAMAPMFVPALWDWTI